MHRTGDEPRPEPSGGLDERVLSTLQGLQGRIAFSGLRRALRAHPESLSRSLRRLEREGRIDRARGGYRALEGVSPGTTDPAMDLRPIAHVELPPGAPADAVLGRLSGRWFGSLRWVGIIDAPEGRLLAWARRDGVGYVLLGIHRGVLRVYVRGEPSGDDATEAEDAAYELLVHAAEALRPPEQVPGTSVTFLAAGPGPLAPSIDN